MLRINNMKIRKDISNSELFEILINTYKLNKNDILSWYISKQSIDARKKDDVHYVYSIDIEVKDENKYKYLEKTRSIVIPKITVTNIFNSPPIVIGAGPAGLFAALFLVNHGIKPIIIEQGETVENRKKTIDLFVDKSILNTFSNIQFGEGGAGTFSDGKLTTGINSPFCKLVLKEFVKFGAPEQILYFSKPHLGTDNLIDIIKNIREYIISKGGVFYFNTKVVDFNIENNKIKSIDTINTKNISEKKTFVSNNIILAIGHSSRTTFEKIYEKGFYLEKKTFSVGVRIEHLQEWINKSQYGNITKLNLPPADYKLSCKLQNDRFCYTFCMCPGGVIVPSSSEYDTVVTNGMSYFLRNGKNANSALLVNILPEDFNSSSPLEGMYFQRDLEKKSFILGGSNYFAPIQRVEDFINNKKSLYIGEVKPSYLPGVSLSNLNTILPNFISESLKDGILAFDKKIHGFANPDAILTGLETRSSSPIRIIRNENLVSNIDGVYPCGEGAGYAGGIMSAAVDGIKCAIALLTNTK